MVEEVDLYDTTGMKVITIVLSDNQAPDVQLDNVKPEMALGVFKTIVSALEDSLPVPTITYDGEVIAAEFCFVGDWDDDDEDW